MGSYGQFWEEPHAQADFSHWAKIPAWSLEEIVALSLNKDPRFVSSDKFVQSTRGTEFSATYFQQLEIVQRHHAAGDLDDRTRTTKVIEWAEEYDFALPQELVERVRDLEERRVKKRELPQQEPTMPAPEKPVHEAAVITMSEPPLESQRPDKAEASSERQLAVGKKAKGTSDERPNKRQLDNLQSLLAVMAISKFQYDPNAAKSPVPQMLAKLLKRYGVSIGAQTIRNHIKDGIDLLPSVRPEK